MTLQLSQSAVENLRASLSQVGDQHVEPLVYAGLRSKAASGLASFA
jgi:hypothetical protein